MSRCLFEKISEIDTNEYLENDLMNINFNCNISIDMIDSNLKNISKTIIELLGESINVLNVNLLQRDLGNMKLLKNKEIEYQLNDLIVMDSINDSDNNQLFQDYKSTLCEALRIVEEQENIGNKRWAQAVQTSFKGIENLVTDINEYRRKITNLRTWKDHNKHTMFLEYPIVRLAGDECVSVDVRDGENVRPFASPIVRLAGDECVSQLADMTPIAIMQTSSDESATKKSRNNRQQLKFRNSMFIIYGWKFSSRAIVKNLPNRTLVSITILGLETVYLIEEK
ncbi:1832_t:CDS:2 [Funneliformis mosseae]|uniref:1832_t:CDS:1 n=1 Tax=Funneliformis mosseae TaxID=27381 RepID=A0A9N9GHG1_FUNMO|nr:1832_t:CDS:2 [Funneliformis mosseae]